MVVVGSENKTENKLKLETYPLSFPRHRRWHGSRSNWLVLKRSKKSRRKRRLLNYRSSFHPNNTMGGTKQIPTISHSIIFPLTFKRNIVVPGTLDECVTFLVSIAQPCHTSPFPAGSECYSSAVARRHFFWDSFTRDTRDARLFVPEPVV